MFRRKRSWQLFIVSACVCVIAFVLVGIGMISSGNSEAIGPGIVFLIMAAALLVGAILVFRTFADTNMGKQDKSAVIRYQMTSKNGVEILDDEYILKIMVDELRQGEEILINLSPEFFGVVSWRFIKIKNAYISFVNVRKKDKIKEYFIAPKYNVDEALAPFMRIFLDKAAVNTADLLEIKRYNATLQFLGLM